MKRVLVLASLVLIIFTWGTTMAQIHRVSLDHVDGADGNGGLKAGEEVAFHIRATNDADPNCMFNTGFGFRVYSEDGAEWGNTTIEPAILRIDTVRKVEEVVVTDTVLFKDLFSQTFSEGQGVDGKLADSVGYCGLTLGGKDPAVRDDFDQVILIIRIKPDKESRGKHICLDAAKAMPSYEWEWSGLGLDEKHPCKAWDIIAEWDGPHCFEVR